MPVDVESCTQSASPKNAWYHYRLKFNSIKSLFQHTYKSASHTFATFSEISKQPFVSSFVLLSIYEKNINKRKRLNKFIADPGRSSSIKRQRVLLHPTVEIAWLYLRPRYGSSCSRINPLGDWHTFPAATLALELRLDRSMVKWLFKSWVLRFTWCDKRIFHLITDTEET